MTLTLLFTLYAIISPPGMQTRRQIVHCTPQTTQATRLLHTPKQGEVSPEPAEIKPLSDSGHAAEPSLSTVLTTDSTSRRAEERRDVLSVIRQQMSYH